MAFQLNLRQVIYSLSAALDLVGVDQLGHGKRVAYMAAECARQLGYGVERFDRLVRASILHDCGVSSTRLHQNLVTEFDWGGAQEHCVWGHELLQMCVRLSDLADIILYHHTHWDQLVNLEIDDEVRELANLIFMVDRVDALSAQHAGENLLLARDAIRGVIVEQSGVMFAPHLVDTFVAVSQRESFWLFMEAHHLDHYLDDWVRAGALRTVEFSALRSIATIFSTIVDAKSPFTAEHSQGVAALARRLGEWSGLHSDVCDKLELAGLLHDLGKLRVPDAILDKPGKLSPEEFALMARHSFDTYSILAPIDGLQEIAGWAAMHHEKVSGAGYPFRRAGDELALEARILAVADVFQALAQERPYRASLPVAKILGILEQMVGDGHLDGELVALLKSRADESWACALLQEGC